MGYVFNLRSSNWISAATTCGTCGYETHLQMHSRVVQTTHPHTSAARQIDGDSAPQPSNPHTRVSGACNAIHINLMANLASDLHLCVDRPTSRHSLQRSPTHPIVSIVTPWHAINLTVFFFYSFFLFFVFFACSLVERHVSSTLLNGTRCVLASIRKLNNKQQFHKP